MNHILFTLKSLHLCVCVYIVHPQTITALQVAFGIADDLWCSGRFRVHFEVFVQWLNVSLFSQTWGRYRQTGWCERVTHATSGCSSIA